MSGDSDLAIRLDAVTEAVAHVTTLLAAQKPLDEVLSEMARNAVDAVAAADAVSVTSLGDERARTVACTDDFALTLDAQQYRTGGPCVESAQTGEPVRVVMGAAQQRWPDFVSAARAAGVRATLSIPLVIAAEEDGGDSELVGSLNVYSRSIPEFGPVDEKLLSLYTAMTCDAITAARRRQRLVDTVAQLEEALVSRSDIDQAKGALRVLHGLTAEDAFTALVERSQRENVKLRVLARRVIEDLSRDLPPR